MRLLGECRLTLDVATGISFGITHPMTTRICIITPVYNDWSSFGKLVDHIASATQGLDCEIEVIAADDCSTERPPRRLIARHPIKRISTLRLTTNLGHQRAIAVGLVAISNRTDIGVVAVMDSDGEDSPDELRKLLTTSFQFPRTVIIAERTKRSEGLRFRFFYHIYVRLFQILTSHSLKFGNFSILPFEYVGQLIARPDTWNNFAASVIRARLPIRSVPTIRRRRYAGVSKMNFVSLILHGLGAMSVFSDVIFIRILLVSLGIFVGSLLGVASVAYLRFFTDLPIPGWTTNVFGFLLLTGFNAVMLTVMMLFIQLNRRASVQQSPKEHALSFVKAASSLSGHSAPDLEQR